MPLFEYTGRAAAAKRVNGRIDAANLNAAALRLETSGVVPVQIRLLPEGHLTAQDVLQRIGVGMPTTTDIVLLTRQMYTIAKSGLPWLRGLRGIAATTHNPVLRAALEDCAMSLEAGRELSRALGEHRGLFPELYISMVEVGEQTGTLDTALLRLAEHLQSQHELRGRVKSAMRYPLIVIGAIVVAMLVLSVFVMPKFAPMFRQLGDALPLPTKILLGSSVFVQSHGVELLLGLVGLVAAWKFYIRRPQGRLLWDRARLRLPVFGKLQFESILARSFKSLALTLNAGLPMIQALKLIERSADNIHIARRFDAVRTLIESGEPLSRATEQSGLFPPLLLQMIEIGEETGELPRLLEEVADFYRREVDYRLANLGALIEPALMVVVGGMVLILALGIFLPMWDMIGRVGGAQ